MTAMITLNGVTKSYGQVKVLDPISLSIEEGSFTALLGASGCGKTTLLNLIAGLDSPSGGEIGINGSVVYSASAGADLPAERRNIGYVFQSYALWPHMRVLDNIAYPLRLRGVGRRERHEAARAMLARLELSALADRYPFELSGGQQQRVAIARALVFRPQVLLLDEPLSSLDAQLRERARTWLAKLQAELKLTTVLVTHDHVEALSLADRVILLRDGNVEQDGPATEVYDTPRTAYAADFVGGANTITATVETFEPVAGQAALALGNGDRLVLPSTPVDPGNEVKIAIRPRRLQVLGHPASARTGSLVLPLTVGARLFQGNDWEVVGTTPLGEMRAISPTVPMNGPVFVGIHPDDCRVLLS
ncbi:ABC transporter ATP-binding protein [Chelatococcus sp. GCM10030263]|uniref:ABC transporter ATP-binding protein n=1 Tax=Chelatococcus sp. GCM10030263 TaxID=3273387 RepID=UPI00360DE4F5